MRPVDLVVIEQAFKETWEKIEAEYRSLNGNEEEENVDRLSGSAFMQRIDLTRATSASL